MTALTTIQRNQLTSQYYAVRGYVYFSKPRVILEARVDGDASSYPVTQFNYKEAIGDFGFVKDGMTITIGSTRYGYDYGITRARLGAIATTLFTGYNSQGTGLGELNVVDDAYVTVWEDFRAWAKIPYISQSGVQFKDSTQFNASTAQPPVARLGNDRLIIVDNPTDSVTISFDGSDSFAIADGATITNYSWILGNGVLTSGTLTSSQIEVTFYGTCETYIQLFVTDSNGNSHRGKRLIAIATVDDCVPVTSLSQTIEPDGVTMEFTVDSGYLDELRLPYTRVLYAQDEYTVDGVGNIVGNETKFSGWVINESVSKSATDRGAVGSVSFTAQDIAGRLNQLPGFPQRVNRESSPSDWFEMDGLNFDRYFHYLLYWHSTALEIADYVPSGTGDVYAFPSFESGGSSMYAQVDSLARAIAHRLTCDTSGTLRVVADPMLQPTAAQKSAFGLAYERTSVSTTYLAERDYTNLQFGFNVPPRNHWLWTEGIIASATAPGLRPAFSVAPGDSPGQGLTSTDLDKQIVESQAELNVRTGHHYAARFNPKLADINLEVVWGGWVWEPALLEWVTVSLDWNNRAPNNANLCNQRCLINSVRNQYDFERGIKRTTLNLEPEQQGLTAIKFEKPDPPQSDNTNYGESYGVGGNFIDGFNIDDYYDDPFPDEIFFPGELPNLVGVGNYRENVSTIYPALMGCSNFGSGASCTWTVTDLSGLGCTGLIYAAQVDPAAPTSMYVATPTEIGKITDMFGTPAYSVLHTFAYSGFTNTNTITLKVGIADPSFVVALINYKSTDTGSIATAGQYAVVSTNSGSSWTETKVSDSYINNTIGYGLHVSNTTAGTAYFWRLMGSGASFAAEQLYVTNDYFSSWSPVTNFGSVPAQTGVFWSQRFFYPYLHEKQLEPNFYNCTFVNSGYTPLGYWDGTSYTYPNFPTPGGIGVSGGQSAIHVNSTNNAYAAFVNSLDCYVVNNAPTAFSSGNGVTVSGVGELLGVHVANDLQTVYAWGDRQIQLSNDLGTTFTSQQGDLASTSGHEFVFYNIAGKP